MGTWVVSVVQIVKVIDMIGDVAGRESVGGQLCTRTVADIVW